MPPPMSNPPLPPVLMAGLLVEAAAEAELVVMEPNEDMVMVLMSIVFVRNGEAAENSGDKYKAASRILEEHLKNHVQVVRSRQQSSNRVETIVYHSSITDPHHPSTQGGERVNCGWPSCVYNLFILEIREISMPFDMK